MLHVARWMSPSKLRQRGVPLCHTVGGKRESREVERGREKFENQDSGFRDYPEVDLISKARA